MIFKLRKKKIEKGSVGEVLVKVDFDNTFRIVRSFDDYIAKDESEFGTHIWDVPYFNVTKGFSKYFILD